MSAQAKQPGGCMLAATVVALIILAIFVVGTSISSKGIVLPFYALIGFWRYWTVKKRQRVDSDRAAAHVVSTIQANELAIRRSTDLSDLGELTSLDPTRFERLIEWLLPSRGFVEVEHCGGPGDRGADLIAIDKNGRRVVVQCKRYGLNHKVGSPEIQRFVGAITIHNANRGMVITTSTYTPEAIAIAGASRVDLIDGATLLGWIRETKS